MGAGYGPDMTQKTPWESKNLSRELMTRLRSVLAGSVI
jgi:hypothetical protein